MGCLSTNTTTISDPDKVRFFFRPFISARQTTFFFFDLITLQGYLNAVTSKFGHWLVSSNPLVNNLKTFRRKRSKPQLTSIRCEREEKRFRFRLVLQNRADVPWFVYGLLVCLAPLSTARKCRYQLLVSSAGAQKLNKCSA